MREFETFRIESVDTLARTVYSVTLFCLFTPASGADAIIDKSLSRKKGKTERYGLPYRFIEIFVPSPVDGLRLAVAMVACLRCGFS